MNHGMAAGIAALLLAGMPATALAASKTIDVGPFMAIDISSGINAVVTVGGEQSVTAESPTQYELDQLVVEVRDGTLQVRIDRGWSIFDLIFSIGGTATTMTISMPELTAAAASAGASVDVDGMSGDEIRLNASSGASLRVTAAAAGSFELDASSGSALSVEGTCERAMVNASSGAGLRAEGLACAAVDIDASSGASADVRASRRLDANASSGASIAVYGGPDDIDRNASSGGSIELRN